MPISRVALRSRTATAAWVFVALVFAWCPIASAADHRITVGGGTIDVAITGAEPVPVSSLLRWIDTAARAVTAYFGRYPLPHVRLFVRAGGNGGIGHGVTHGGPAPSIRIQVGNRTTESDLIDDWVLTHEMVHLAFPNLTTDDSWAEEGLATYVEPLARLKLGTLTEQTVWSGLVDRLPQGLPRRGDRGLHATGEWGRIYWGGALFWLLADVEIRERTGNRRGLPDALAAIRDAGGDIRANWELRRVLETADRGLGLTVLSDLYQQHALTPQRVDLDGFWRRLGVRRVGGRITFDDGAGLAHVRRAIVGERVGEPHEQVGELPEVRPSDSPPRAASGRQRARSSAQFPDSGARAALLDSRVGERGPGVSRSRVRLRLTKESVWKMRIARRPIS